MSDKITDITHEGLGLLSLKQQEGQHYRLICNQQQVAGLIPERY